MSNITWDNDHQPQKLLRVYEKVRISLSIRKKRLSNARPSILHTCFPNYRTLTISETINSTLCLCLSQFKKMKKDGYPLSRLVIVVTLLPENKEERSSRMLCFTYCWIVGYFQICPPCKILLWSGSSTAQFFNGSISAVKLKYRSEKRYLIGRGNMLILCGKFTTLLGHIKQLKVIVLLQIASRNDVRYAPNVTKCTFIVHVSLYNEISNGCVAHFFGG
jgi:hypothetical protein